MKDLKDQRMIRVWFKCVVSVVLFSGMASLSQIHAQGLEDAIIYLDSTQQVIRGFGAANILPWRPDMTIEQVNTAFGTGDGELGFTILRLRVPQNQSEFAAQVPTAQLAYSFGAALIASPWSPPTSMKTNNNSKAGELKAGSYAAFAAHLKAFADYMADHDAPLYAISVQNEPDASVDYESCDWNGTQMLDFMKNHAASVGIPVMMPESMNFNHELSDPALNDPDAAANIAIIAGHLYGGGLGPYALAAEKGKELWMTEYLNLDTTWTACLATGKQIHDCMNYGMSAYVWWYIVRYYGPILEDGTVSKRGFVMSQYSRFIRPGYERIYTASPRRKSIYVTAYQGDSQIVIVAVNMNSSSREQKFYFGELPNAIAVLTPYVTSRAKNCEQGDDTGMSGGSFKATLDGSSITTFVAENMSNGIENRVLPETIRLSQNYPNPFNPETHIAFSIPKSDFVILKIYDMLGQEIQILTDKYYTAGDYHIAFNAESLTSGVYFCKLQVGSNYIQTKKMLLMR